MKVNFKSNDCFVNTWTFSKKLGPIFCAFDRNKWFPLIIIIVCFWHRHWINLTMIKSSIFSFFVIFVKSILYSFQFCTAVNRKLKIARKSVFHASSPCTTRTISIVFILFFVALHLIVTQFQFHNSFFPSYFEFMVFLFQIVFLFSLFGFRNTLLAWYCRESLWK